MNMILSALHYLESEILHLFGYFCHFLQINGLYEIFFFFLLIRRNFRETNNFIFSTAEYSGLTIAAFHGMMNVNDNAIVISPASNDSA